MGLSSRRTWLFRGLASTSAIAAALFTGQSILASSVELARGKLPQSIRDEGPIAFSRPDGIFVSDPVGSDPVRVGSGAAEPLHWSPDRKWLAYTEFNDWGGWDLFAMQSDGSEKRQLSQRTTDQDNGTLGFNWSPDGSQITYAYGETTQAGGDETYLAVQTLDGDPTRLVEGFESIAFPVWSPDGAQIAFGATEESTPGIYLVSASGGEPSMLTSRRAGNLYPTDWSSDGKSITYTYYRRWGPDVSDIGIVDAGTGEFDLLPDRGKEYHSRFSPDGSRIAYLAIPRGSVVNSEVLRLWTTDRDGRNRALIARWLEPLNMSFDWSQTGNYLAYLRGRRWDATRSDVFISTSNGSARWRVTDTNAFELWVDWRSER